MRKLYGDSLPTQKEIEANKLANAKRREEEATPPTPSGEGSDAATCSVVTGSLDDLKQDFDQRLNNLSHKELVASFRAIGCEVEIAESISDESFSILAADDYEEYGDDPLY